MAVFLIAVLVATLAPCIRLGPQVPTGGLPIGQQVRRQVFVTWETASAIQT
jgi:hypothetical protein